MQLRRPLAVVVATMASLVAGACVTSPSAHSTSAQVALPGALRWSGSLTPQNGSAVRGSAVLTPVESDSARTRALVSISGATAGALLPWHVHQGACGEHGGIVGPAGAYPPLVVAPDGNAQVTVALPFPIPAGGSYSVNIHASQARMDSILACANLALGRP